MASIEARTAPIEALTALDADTLAMLDALVAASGWNQTADDWALFAEQGKVRVMRAERRPHRRQRCDAADGATTRPGSA